MNPVTLRRALQDQRLLGNALPGPSWRTWRALLLASRGEPLEPAELELVRAVHRRPPSTELARARVRRGGRTPQWKRLRGGHAGGLPLVPGRSFACFAARRTRRGLVRWRGPATGQGDERLLRGNACGVAGIVGDGRERDPR